jgi:hypothetical protein
LRPFLQLDKVLECGPSLLEVLGVGQLLQDPDGPVGRLGAIAVGGGRECVERRCACVEQMARGLFAGLVLIAVELGDPLVELSDLVDLGVLGTRRATSHEHRDEYRGGQDSSNLGTQLHDENHHGESVWSNEAAAAYRPITGPLPHLQSYIKRPGGP